MDVISTGHKSTSSGRLHRWGTDIGPQFSLTGKIIVRFEINSLTWNYINHIRIIMVNGKINGVTWQYMVRVCVGRTSLVRDEGRTSLTWLSERVGECTAPAFSLPPVGDEARCCRSVEFMLGASRTRSCVVWLHHGEESGSVPVRVIGKSLLTEWAYRILYSSLKQN